MEEQIAQLLANQNRLFGELMQRVAQGQPQQQAAVATTAHVSQHVPLPPPLAIDGDMEENFSFFESNWRNYATAIGMDEWPNDEDSKKVSFLLSVVGTPALKKYFNFELTAQDKENADNVLAAIKRKVVSTRNVIVDRLDFFSTAQSPSESIDDFVSRLKVMARPCRFGALESELLTYKLVTSNKWPQLRSKLLTMPDVTTTKAIDLCRMEEITSKHSKALSLDQSADVNLIKSTKPRKCKFCGDYHAFVKGSCPAYGKKCKRCHGRNHFEKVCRAEKSRSSKSRKSRKVNEVKEDDTYTDASESDTDYSDHLEESEVEAEIGRIFDCSQKGGNVLAEIQLKVGEEWKKVKCDLDTGANTSLIGLDWLRKLTGSSDPKLLPSPYKLQAFGGAAIRVLGQIKLPCKHKDKKYRLVLQVVDVNHRPLLSLKVCTTLGLVKFCNAVTVEPSAPAPNQQELLRIYRIQAQQIVEQYEDVFKGYGSIAGEVCLEIDSSIPPVIQQPRRVPIALRDKLKLELDKLLKDGIIAKEPNHTDWVSNVLLVKRGPVGAESFRICLDPIPLNKALKRPNLQFVTLDEILPELGQAKVFSTVDARKGFWHIMLDDASSKLTTFWTPFGRYRWLRLPFGISSAPEIFQSKLQEIIQELKGVECLADDLIVYGRGGTLEEALQDHNRNFDKLMACLQKNNVKLNKSKLKLCDTSVKFYGHVLSDQGLQPDESKLSTIKHYPVPSNRAELHRFIGMVTYLSRFIPNLSANFSILRKLISDKVPWSWSVEEDEEFRKVKGLVADIQTLRYYDVRQPLLIECDASCFGLGVAVFQENGIIGYASRTLSDSEKNYAQIEKELLAILFACIRFDQLIVGNPKVVVKTDHKPLVNIFKKPLLNAPKRLQHMLLNLQRYSLEIQFVTGKDNVVADAISRAPHNDTGKPESFEKMHIYKVFKELENWRLDTYLKISDDCLTNIMDATKADPALQVVMGYIRNGWPRSIGRVPAVAKMLFKYRNELSTQDGLIFRNDRIYIPTSLQRSMVDRVHVSHNGIESSLKLARENIFWPGMSAHITDVVKECATCAKFAASQQKPPMKSHPIPVYPFQIVSMDVFFAEYRGRKRNFLVTVDHYSDYFELDILKDMTGRSLVETCRINFARHGVPQLVVTDNGTNFVNEDMKEMARTWNFTHSTSAPHHQQANGKAEATVKIAKRLIQKAEETKTDLWYAVLHWRNIPNKIGSSPTCRLFSRSTRCGVPASAEKYAPRVVPNVSEAILDNRRMSKYFYDRKTHHLPELQVGTPVVVQLEPQTTNIWTPGVVCQKYNDRSYLVESNGSSYRRDIVHIKPRKEPTPSPQATIRDHSVLNPNIDNERTTSWRKNVTATEPTKPTSTVTIDNTGAAAAATFIPQVVHSGEQHIVDGSHVQSEQQSGTKSRGVSSTSYETVVTSERPRREKRLPSKFNDYVLDN